MSYLASRFNLKLWPLQEVVGDVNILFPNPGVDTQLCDADGAVVTIEFLDRYGE